MIFQTENIQCKNNSFAGGVKEKIKILFFE